MKNTVEQRNYIRWMEKHQNTPNILDSYQNTPKFSKFYQHTLCGNRLCNTEKYSHNLLRCWQQVSNILE